MPRGRGGYQTFVLTGATLAPDRTSMHRAAAAWSENRFRNRSSDMLKKLVLASALVATSAWAQQNTDISGASFQAGKADATLAALGRSAAASGRRLVITAPPEWHAKIQAKVRAGGNAEVVMRDGFYENVLVRVEDKGAADKAAKQEPDRSRAEIEKARAEAERSRAEAERAKADAERSRREAEQARAEADAATARLAQQAAAARAAAAAGKPAPTPAAPVAAPAAPAAPRASAAADVDAIHARLEKSLNEGRSASGTIGVGALQSGDTLYVDGPVRAITRREGLRPVLYWLEGDLDLRRTELKPLGADRYQVLGSIRGEGSLRREFAAGAASLAAAEPAAGSPARVTLEKNLNEGHAVVDTIEPARLRSGDVVYTSGTAALVVRREGRDISRYWLVGTLDLSQSGIQADGANRYKVLNDTVH
jgi:hypothetical protein